ncbi:hypothetical protein GCM10027294_25540 [Marinactinospora endophytica]
MTPDDINAAVATFEGGEVERRRLQQRRARFDWWLQHVAPLLPDGARPRGWDSLLVTGKKEERAAREFFEARPATVVISVTPRQAAKLGLRDDDSLKYLSAPGRVVVGWKWACGAPEGA